MDEIKPENMKLVSVSPFRAVIKVEDDEDSLDEEFQREGPEPSQLEPFVRNSPLRSDSLAMRQQREEPLNERTLSLQTTAQQVHDRIQKESEYMRIQRENYINGFKSSPTRETLQH